MLPTSIALQNASNLRDLGGWPTQDGRTVRTGLVFRAPALINLGDADQATIAALGLRTICDFRGVRERAANPVTIAQAENLSLPIEPSVGAGLRDILRTGQATGHMTLSEMLDLLGEAYRAYALQSFAQYRAMFERILAPGGLPLLLHCSAGKDRTGFGSALLLRALGVAWEHAIQDYLPPKLKDVLLSAHETLLTAAFDAIDATHGSLDTYLATAIGLDAPARARLQALRLA